MAEQDSHRGGFGEHGGDARGALIDRTFREKIVLAGVTLPPATDLDTEQSLDELELLVDTAGADVEERVLQRRKAPDPGTYIGRGKAEELRVTADRVDADTVVFDDELTPGQQRNLEKLLGRTAIDRTAVILDIFAQNAHSQEGKAQVELAQLRYSLPRLRGKGTKLSQQAGGIGTRGPGETQLEVDRRRIERRIHRLEGDLRAISRHRHTQRKARKRSRIPTVAIVGYTNAGKSTLLNRITGAGVLVEDRLFATLDSTTRRYDKGSEPMLLIDTVGFVRKLPHELVEAFKSTLEVVHEADLLIHVVDATAADPELQIGAVHDVLAQIDAAEIPEVLALNKSDQVTDPAVLRRHPGAVAISARTGAGVDELMTTVSDRLRALTAVVELCIPFDRGDIAASVHRDGEVLVESADEGGLRIRARLDDSAVSRLRQYVVDDDVS
jgi:GTP-binding protein HflX